MFIRCSCYNNHILPLLQEAALLRSRVGGEVDVAVDASPSTDLNQAMSEIREHLELESWYRSKVGSFNQCHFMIGVS